MKMLRLSETMFCPGCSLGLVGKQDFNDDEGFISRFRFVICDCALVSFSPKRNKIMYRIHGTDNKDVFRM